MSPLVMRRRPRADEPSVVNADVVAALGRAAEDALTGVVEVSDRAHRSAARVFLYGGGIYAVELDGYQPPVAARLDAAGRFDALGSEDRTLLSALPDPDATAAALAVDRGWIAADALALVHQEFVLASAGAALTLHRARTRTRPGEVTDRVCTLPIPVSSVVETVRLRTRRLDDTWAMVDAGHPRGRGVLSRTDLPVQGVLSVGEAGHLAAEFDGKRTLDEVAFILGLTRAEAVHLASLLLNAGLAVVESDAEPSTPQGPLLVPEEFGSRSAPRLAALVPASVPSREPDQDVATVGDEDDTPPEPTSAAVSAPPAAVDPVTAARADVARRQAELLDCVRAEHAAVARTAEASQLLEEATARLARLEAGE